jgi:hypothetical protein
MATAAASVRAPSATAWLARGMWLVAVAMVGLTGFLLLETGHVAGAFVQGGAGGVELVSLMFATLGMVVALRQPWNRMGWILLGVGLLYALVSPVDAYFDKFNSTQSWFPAARPIVWLGSWAWMPALGTLATFVLLLFPDGHLPSRGWWPLAVVSGVLVYGTSAFAATVVWPHVPELLAGREPHVPHWINLVINGGAVLVGCCMVGAVVGVVRRYRRSPAEQRQQFKWLTYGAIGLAAAIASTYLPGLSSHIALPGFFWFGACVGVAILRYRLYDIDVIVNRTLVYGALTALLGGIYLGAVFGLGALVRSIGGHGNNGLVVAASTLAVAALFSPARRALQAFIDRRFYRRKYDAARTLESFGARLRDDVDLDDLSGHLVGVVRETMQPAQVSLWLRASGNGAAARSGAEGTRS